MRSSVSSLQNAFTAEALESRLLFNATLVKDIYPGSNGSNPFLFQATLNGHVLFSANNGTATELWASDGTAANTVVLKNIIPATIGSNNFQLVVGNKMYFAAYDATDGNALFVTDGTPAGTSLVYAPSPGKTTTYTLPLAWVNGYLLFTATDATHGDELWRTDGTTANTQLLMDINPGTASSNPTTPAILNGIMYFRATDAIHGNELWRSDGTPAGTYLVDDIYPGSTSSATGTPALFVYNNMLLFQAESSASTGYELWKSDGTPAGTSLIKDIYPGTSSSSPGTFTLYNGQVYFRASDSSGDAGLWCTDGSAAGTTLVAEDAPTALILLNAKLYFIDTDTDQLFVSQGVAATTAAITPTTFKVPPQFMSAIDGRLFFDVNDTFGTGSELWTYDGTSTGATIVQDLNPGNGGGFLGNYIVGLNGAIYVEGSDGVHGAELFQYPDIYPPIVTSASATVAGLGSPRLINFSFSENVSTNLSASSLQLTNLTTGLSVTTSPTGYAYNTSTNTATFTLPAAALVDARYRATIPASLLVDSQGLTAASSANLEFVSVAANAGNNSIQLSPSSDGSSLVVYKNSVQSFTTPWNSLGSVIVTAGSGNDSLSITLGANLPSGGFSFDGGAGNNTMSITGTTGRHTVASSSMGLTYDLISIAAINSTSINFNPSGGTNSLYVNTPLTLIPASGTAVVLNSFYDSSTLDLTSNAVDFTASTFAAILPLVQSGYNSGKWNGTGIDSSLAAGDSAHLTSVGLVQNNQGGTALFSSANLFDGITPGTADVLAKYTYFGDANLDGKVDGSDYTRIDSAFLNHALTGWLNGDFNYDGIVNGSDYTLIDNAFNTQSASLAAQSVAETQTHTHQQFIPQYVFSSSAIFTDSDLISKRLHARHSLLSSQAPEID